MHCTSTLIKGPVHQWSQVYLLPWLRPWQSSEKLYRLAYLFMLHLTSHIRCNTLLMAALKPALSETSSIMW